MPIIVRPVQANLTHDTDLYPINRMDPYCYISIGGERKKTTTCHSGGRNPAWGDTFSFMNMSGDTTIRIEVWDKDTFTPDDLIGEGSFNIMQAMSTGMPINQYVDLYYKGRHAGSILLYIHCQGMMGMGGVPMGMGMPMGVPMGGYPMSGYAMGGINGWSPSYPGF